MAGVADFLFQGNPIPPQPTGSDTSTSFPQWLQQYTYNLANAATNLANSPYTPYTGQQVATPSAQTQQAWQMAGQNVGNYMPYLGGAGALTMGAANAVNGNDINTFMNPYMDKVIGGLQTAANKNLMENQLPAIQAKFVSAGQSRSPQEAQLTDNAIYQSNQALDQAMSGALSQGFQNAVNSAFQQKQQYQTAGAQFGQLGALAQQLGAGDIGQLAAAGQAQDTTNQANLNAALNNFYAQQQWPYQNLSFASNIIRGQAVPSNQQVVGLQYSPYASYTKSPLSTFAGTLMGGQGLWGNGGYRRGGPVRAAPANDVRGVLSRIA